MKSWKKTHRQRKRSRSKILTLSRDIYLKYNHLRIKMGLSWKKLVEMAIRSL